VRVVLILLFWIGGIKSNMGVVGLAFIAGIVYLFVKFIEGIIKLYVLFFTFAIKGFSELIGFIWRGDKV